MKVAQSNSLALVGAAVGGMIGYFAFVWLAIRPTLAHGAKSRALHIAIAMLFLGIARQSTICADDAKSIGNDGPQMAKQISGTVLTPDGKPAAGAKVVVLGLPWSGMYRPDTSDWVNEVIAQGACDEKGRFTLDHLKSSSHPWQQARLFASAKGFALEGLPIDLYLQRLENLQLKLESAHEIRGRVLKPNGEPAADVPVRVNVIYNVSGQWDTYLSIHAHDLNSDIYPSTLTTNAQGEITIGQLPANATVGLSTDVEGYMPNNWDWRLNTEAKFEATLSPAQIVNAVVVAADSKQPVANATVDLSVGRLLRDASRTDAEGRVKLRMPTDANKTEKTEVHVSAPYNTPYFGNKLTMDAQTDLTKDLQIELPRGVMVTGRVVEQDSGRPVAGAGVGYLPASKNPNAKGITFRAIGRPAAITDENGSFTLGVVEGPGTLVVWNASVNYVLHPLSQNELVAGKPVMNVDSSTTLVFAHVSIAVPAGAKVFPVQIPIERGVTVVGNLVNSDGAAPELASMTYRCMGQDYTDVLRQSNNWPIYDGHFAIHGVPADGEMLVYFLDALGKQGKMLTVHGSDAPQPLKVKLEKCGSATMRFIDVAGKGVPGYLPKQSYQFALLLLPENALEASTSMEDFLTSEQIEPSAFDSLNYKDLMSDEDGRLTLPALIPGAIYKLNFRFLGSNKKFPHEFKVRPGENLDLPDVVISDAKVVSQAAERWKKRQQPPPAADSK